MKIYKHVLAVVDLGEASVKILQHAAQLAELYGARLTVLHVVNYSVSPDFDYVLPPEDEIEKTLVETARQRLQELLVREVPGTGVNVTVVTGRPKVEILRTAERESVDLIVVGAHGHHGIGGLLGSTTDAVVHRATCNVLTVR